MEEATIALACGTVVLAAITAWAVVDSRCARKREKRDRTIAEIADWAVAVLESLHEVGLPNIDSVREDDIAYAKDATMTYLGEKARQRNLAIARGAYVGKLAGRTDPDLGKAVDETLGVLRKDVDALRESMRVIDEVAVSIGAGRYTDVLGPLLAESLNRRKEIHAAADCVLSCAAEVYTS